MGVYVKTNIYSRTSNCTITKQIHASCAILFITKKKKIAQPSFYRLKRPPKNFKGQSPKYVNYEIKNQQSVVGMGANNRRGNVFELKLDGAEVFYNSSTHAAGQLKYWIPSANFQVRRNLCCWSSNSHNPSVFTLAIRKSNYKRSLFKDGWAGIVQGHNRTKLNRRPTLWKHRDINCFWYVCLLVF